MTDDPTEPTAEALSDAIRRYAKTWHAASSDDDAVPRHEALWEQCKRIEGWFASLRAERDELRQRWAGHLKRCEGHPTMCCGVCVESIDAAERERDEWKRKAEAGDPDAKLRELRAWLAAQAEWHFEQAERLKGDQSTRYYYCGRGLIHAVDRADRLLAAPAAEEREAEPDDDFPLRDWLKEFDHANLPGGPFLTREQRALAELCRRELARKEGRDDG